MLQYNLTETNIVAIILWILYFIGLYLIFFWISIFLSNDYSVKKNKKIKLLKKNEYPNLTIIIPMFNEEETIEKTIKSLYNINYDFKKLRVICVNDGSTDSSLKILKKLNKKYPFEILNQKNQGKYIALNNAIKKTKTEFFLCLDADSYPKKNSLKYLISEFITTKENYASISPLMIVHKPKKFIQKIQWVEYIFSVFFKYLASHIDSVMVVSGPFSLYRTKIVKKIGYFQEGYLTEDFEIALRFQKNNYKILQSNKAEVETSTPNSFKKFINQRIRWNFGNFMCMKKYFKNFMFKKEFHDFGLFVFPSYFFGGIFLTFSFILLTYLLIKSIFRIIINFSLVNYDFLTYIKNYKFEFSYYDLNLKMLSISIFLIIIMFTIFYVSMKETGHNSKLKKIILNFFPFMFYLFLFRFIMLFVWLKVFTKIILKKKVKW